MSSIEDAARAVQSAIRWTGATMPEEAVDGFREGPVAGATAMLLWMAGGNPMKKKVATAVVAFALHAGAAGLFIPPMAFSGLVVTLPKEKTA